MGQDTNGALILPRQIPMKTENADWSYALDYDDVMSEWQRLMLLQFLEERENTASQTQRGRWEQHIYFFCFLINIYHYSSGHILL